MAETGACGAIVFIEPSPYEISSFLTMALFLIGGLSFPTSLLPFSLLLILINVGYNISAAAVSSIRSLASTT